MDEMSSELIGPDGPLGEILNYQVGQITRRVNDILGLRKTKKNQEFLAMAVETFTR